MEVFLERYSRTQILRFILIAAIAVICLRLFYLQVIRYDYYDAQADALQVTPLTIVPERGQIFTYENKRLIPLVLNERVYTVFVDPEMIKDPTKVVSTLRQIAGGEVLNGLDELVQPDEENKIRYRVVAHNVSHKQAELIREAELSGVGLQETNRRFYPEGNMGAQMLGYLNSEGKGQYGLEEALDTRLSGEKGMWEAVTDVHQIPLTIGDSNIRKPAKDGDDIVLTIDRTVQYKTEEFLREGLKRAQATSGSVVVMNPNNGAVLAMASAPTYDPAKYFEVENYQVLQNPVISMPFENGSVIKVLTVAAGLDSGAVTPQSTFNDITGCTWVADAEICNVEEDPRQASASMLDTLQYSLNTGVVHVVRQMGGGNEINDRSRQQLWNYFHNKFRFGELTGIEQAGESSGVIISPKEDEGNAVRYANMSFGQGMDLTMIQTTAAFSAVMNGGTYYQPHLVAGIVEPNGAITEQKPKVVARNIVSAQASRQAVELTHQGRKQGFFGQFDREGVMVGGKTGTSQVIDPETGRYSDDNSIGTYLGFGGIERPEYVIMVRVDDAKVPGYQGTTAAGPIFNDISNWMLNHMQLEARR